MGIDNIGFLVLYLIWNMKIKATVDGLELELTVPDETFRSEKYPEGSLTDGYRREVEDFQEHVIRCLERVLAESVLPASLETKRRIEARLNESHDHSIRVERARRQAHRNNPE